MPLEEARKVYTEAMDGCRARSVEHAAAVTHAVLGLIVAERADEARASADKIAALEEEIKAWRDAANSVMG